MRIEIYATEVTVIRRAFPVALVFATVGWTALQQGGFFATSWGWPTLVFLLVATVVLINSDRVRLGRRDRVMLLALAGLVCWTSLSALWAPGAELPIDAGQLALLYLAAVAAFLLLDSVLLPLGILCAVTPVAAYALATRLVPDHVGTYDPQAGGYLLAGPVGYQNCLGMLCALATLVALGVVAYAGRLVVRCAAAVSLVILLPTLYFTFSRGAVAALLVGILVAAVLDRRRRRFSVVVLGVLPLPLVGAWLCSRSGPLTRAGAPLSAAAHDGHRVLGVLLALGVLQVGAVALLEKRNVVTPRIWCAYAVVLGTLVAVGLAGIGSPLPVLGHRTHAFTANSPAYSEDLDRRLVTLSGHSRGAYWTAAWHEVSDHPLLGGGGGTFRQYWLRYRPIRADVLNAHNLYLETLAELGPIGLALLLAALAVPIAAAIRARENPLVPVIAGAYTAALAHAAVDWDWQLPTLTLATFALGTTLVIAARRPTEKRDVTTILRAAMAPLILALVTFVFVAQLGRDALAAAEHAVARGDPHTALADARSARNWLPWAAQPWQQIGEAQLADGDAGAAKASFGEAIRLDGTDWSYWLDLAETSNGTERRQALTQAARLNPLGQAPQGSGR